MRADIALRAVIAHRKHSSPTVFFPTLAKYSIGVGAGSRTRTRTGAASYFCAGITPT
jgi:hypothetical protein